MIHSMSLDLETFAAKRRGLMEEYDKGLEPHVADALKRVGLASWEYHLVQYLEKLFTDLVKAESEEWVPAMEDLRDEFVREVAETLRKTTPVPPERFNEQVQRVTRWLSTMTINAATEAAVAGDEENVGLEWVTMEDDKVRVTHREMHGSRVPTGNEFELPDGTKVMYPGQPKGDPSNWINCRCAARPALLEGFSAMTAAAEPKEEEPVEGQINEEEEEAAHVPPDGSIQVPWHSVLAPLNTRSGDGRMLKESGISWRQLPLPIKSMFVDDEGHKGSVVVGRADRIWIEDGLLKGEGVFDTSPAAYETVRMLAEGMWRGISVDIDAAEMNVVMNEETGEPTMEFDTSRVCASTVCAIPAFAEAWIRLGTWADDPEFQETPAHAEVSEDKEPVMASGQFRPVPPKTKDGPGWITHPDPTEDITNYWVDGRGAAKIRWGQGGDFNRCRTQLAKYVQNPDWLAGLCANLHYRALGIWPGEHKATAITADASASMPSVIMASAGTVTRPSVDFFTNPNFTEVTPITVDEETGEVFGHIAAWDTCHVAYKVCVTPPHSQTDYSYFLTGELVTDAGPVPVGRLSYGGGHADGNLGIVAAMAHYDNVANAFADVYCGEDDHGIWVHGLMREGLTAKDIREFRASPPSGDWRNVVVRGEEQLEMIAVCAVNVPGFPVPRVRMQGERQTSLIAAGVVPVPENEGDRRAERIEAFRAKAREMKLARIQNEIRKLKEK